MLAVWVVLRAPTLDSILSRLREAIRKADKSNSGFLLHDQACAGTLILNRCLPSL